MIWTILHIGWLNLKRDYVALGLTFVLPIAFFSIFAVIMGGVGSGGGDDGGPASMKIAAVDLDGTAISRRFITALDEQGALEVHVAPPATDETPDPAPFDRDAARRAVRLGRYPAAVVIPAGFGEVFGSFTGNAEPVELIHDPSNPLAQHTVAGLLQASAMMAAPDVLMEKGLGQLETFGGALTDEQRTAVDAFLPVLRGDRSWDDLTDDTTGGGESEEAAPGGAGPAFTGLVEVTAVSARADEGEGGDGAGSGANSIVAYYAAGIGVMFLLFSMSGAASTLLEEEESGTLERLLSSNVGMGTVLVGRWLFFGAVGFLQMTVMFVWGAIVFGLDLFTLKHVAGFVVMTAVTAAAAAAFGLILATLCRSRAQHSGLSTIVILIMSALGGSMVPRFIMPEFMNTTALFTFNGWALDGYLKVFWYDDPAAGLAGSLQSLAPQLGMLAALTVVFLVISRLLARRWETG